MQPQYLLYECLTTYKHWNDTPNTVLRSQQEYYLKGHILQGLLEIGLWHSVFVNDLRKQTVHIHTF